ncbi:MAG: hypothetical protein RIT00_1090 [Actinomycetota bacterium]
MEALHGCVLTRGYLIAKFVDFRNVRCHYRVRDRQQERQAGLIYLRRLVQELQLARRDLHTVKLVEESSHYLELLKHFHI